MNRKYSIAISEIGGFYAISCSSWIEIDGQRQEVKTLSKTNFETDELAWEEYIKWKSE